MNENLKFDSISSILNLCIDKEMSKSRSNGALKFTNIPVIFIEREFIKTYPVLYKTTPKGAKIQWHIRIFEDDQGNLKLITERGHVSGKIITDITPIIAKSTRTPIEQAIQEADQRYKEKIRKNYRPRPKEGERAEELFIKPYLLKQYATFAERIRFPASIEPKLDGIRGILGFFDSELNFISRKCVTFPNPLDHLKIDFLESELPKEDTIFYDGELYIHDPDVHEVDIGGDLRREPPYTKEQLAFTQRIEFWVFDYVDLDQPELTYAERRRNLGEWFEIPTQHIYLVPEVIVYNHNQIDEETKRFMDNGYEGAVVRNLDFKYNIKGPRICDALKVIGSFDEEYKIVGATKDKYDQVVWILEYTNPQGKKATFKATHAGTPDNPVTREYRQLLYRDRRKYIGQLATVRYRVKTKTGKPKFPRVIKLRERMG